MLGSIEAQWSGKHHIRRGTIPSGLWEEIYNKPAGASAMTWLSTYVLLVLLILPKNNSHAQIWQQGAKIESIV